MIRDALAGKIDLIVTKSVSRFARNTVDSLTTIRKLKEAGCECFFQKENIMTFDSKGELLITIISVTFSCLWSIVAMRSITANALDFGYAGRNISCVRNAEILISRKNVSSRPFWAIWGKLKPEGNLPSRRSQSRSHTAHIQSTQDSLRCTFITAICSVGSKNGSTRRACRRTCEKRS